MISHHDFRKAICLHWINPDEVALGVIDEEQEEIFAEVLPMEEFSIARRSAKGTLSPLSSSTCTKPKKKKKPLKTCQRITDATLDPASKKLRVRLDRTLDHFSER